MTFIKMYIWYVAKCNLGEVKLNPMLARRQHGRVVRAPDLKSGGPGFKSRSDHYLNLFSVVPSSNPRSCL